MHAWDSVNYPWVVTDGIYGFVALKWAQGEPFDWVLQYHSLRKYVSFGRLPSPTYLGKSSRALPVHMRYANNNKKKRRKYQATMWYWHGQKEMTFVPPASRTWGSSWRTCFSMHKEDGHWTVVLRIIIFSHHHGPTVLLAGGPRRRSFRCRCCLGLLDDLQRQAVHIQ